MPSGTGDAPPASDSMRARRDGLGLVRIECLHSLCDFTEALSRPNVRPPVIMASLAFQRVAFESVPDRVSIPIWNKSEMFNIGAFLRGGLLPSRVSSEQRPLADSALAQNS